MMAEDWRGADRTLLQRELAARGIVMIQGHLDSRLATFAAASLMERDALADEVVRVRLSTTSGEFGPALTVMDTIAALGVPTEVMAVGAVDGPGLGILAVAGRRLATRHCRLAFGSPLLRLDGSAGLVARQLDQELQDQGRWVELVAHGTHQPAERVEVDLSTARILSPQEALRYRLLDDVVGPAGSSAESGK